MSLPGPPAGTGRLEPAVQALSWKELRQLRSSLISVPAWLVAGTWLLSRLPPHEPFGELLLFPFGPCLAAVAGAAGTSNERRKAGLDWLRARAVSPDRILRVKLAWQAVLLLLSALTAGLIAGAWPGQTVEGWSEVFDAPAPDGIAFGLLAWVAAFAWTAGLSWRSQSGLVVLFGGLLATWFQAGLLLAPAALWSVRAEEVLSRTGWLVPAFLGPPVLFAAWAFRRWDPLRAPWPARRWAGLFTAVLALALAGEWIAVRPAREARALQGSWTELPIRSVATQLHPRQEELRARELLLADGGTRVVIDDGTASRTILPRGTRMGPWLGEKSPELGVRWPDGSWRGVSADGRSRSIPPQPALFLTAGGGEAP